MLDTNLVRESLTDTIISQKVLEQHQTSTTILQAVLGCMAVIMLVLALSVFLRRNSPKFIGQTAKIWRNIIGCTFVGILFVAGVFGVRHLDNQNRIHIDDWYVLEGEVGEIRYYREKDNRRHEYYYTYVPYGDGKQQKIKLFDDARIEALRRDPDAYIICNYRGVPISVYSTQLYNYVGE